MTLEHSHRSFLLPLLLAGTTMFVGCNTTKSDIQTSDKPTTPATDAMQLPPGWTAEDMQACMLAGTPGPMHELLTESAGTWTGTSTMWMGPDSDPITMPMTSTITPVMDGRYTRCEVEGEIPGMGAFRGMGYSGYDNVTQKFVSTWIDNQGTGIMNGKGELSSDQKTLSWTFQYNCPLTKKVSTMREIDRFTGENSMTMEIFGTDPKSGKEYAMMKMVMERKPGSKPGA